MNTWISEWPLLAWQTIALIGFVFSAVVLGYLWQSRDIQSSKSVGIRWLRFLVLTTCRLIALAMLFWMLGGLTLIRLEPTAGGVWFAIDSSGSMSIADQPSPSNDLTRFKSVIETVTDMKERLGQVDPNVRIKYFSVGDSLKETSLDSLSSLPADQLEANSRIEDALQNLFSQAKMEQPRAIFLFTDGRDTESGTLINIDANAIGETTKLVVFPLGNQSMKLKRKL